LLSSILTQRVLMRALLLPPPPQGLAMMEQPFGSDIMDLPCLSYVCAAADTSLRMVEGRGAAAADASADQRLVSELLRLDAGELVNEPTTKRSQKMAA
jgi:hypothetical protein